MSITFAVSAHISHERRLLMNRLVFPTLLMMACSLVSGDSARADNFCCSTDGVDSLDRNGFGGPSPPVDCGSYRTVEYVSRIDPRSSIEETAKLNGVDRSTAAEQGTRCTIPQAADVSKAIVVPIVLAENLDFAYGTGALAKQILFGVNLRIEPGEIVLLTGPSGSGKTTLLTLIGALRRPQGGRLTVLGRELHDAPPGQLVEVRKHIGYIFQNHNLLKFLTARQNIRLSLQLHPQLSDAEWRDRELEILERVGLTDRMHYHPDNLSGGQKQRVAIARALVARPQLVLADEPTASLDGKTGRDVVNLMQQLSRDQGCPILMVTHDNRVLDIADRIVHMEDGRIESDRVVSERAATS